MSCKERYRQLCKAVDDIPIFSRDWWLDAVYGADAWDVSLVEDGSGIVAALPYCLRRRFVFKIITMPKLTPTVKLWIRYSSSSRPAKRLSHEKEVITRILEQLPDCDYFCANFHPSLTNWLPFHWKGFQQTTLYTYIVEDLSNLDEVFKSFSHAKRKNIKRAEKLLCVGPDFSATDFYAHHKMTLGKSGQTISYPFDLFQRIYSAVRQRDCGRVFSAVDSKGSIHSAIFVVWDNMKAYDLISTIDPAFKSSGSASFLVREAMRYVKSRTRMFDFEGSMIEGVENSFRQFGTRQKPYFQISKVNSRLLSLSRAIAPNRFPRSV